MFRRLHRKIGRVAESTDVLSVRRAALGDTAHLPGLEGGAVGADAAERLAFWWTSLRSAGQFVGEAGEMHAETRAKMRSF